MRTRERFFGVIGQIRTLSGSALDNRTRYQLVLPSDKVNGVLGEMMLLDAREPFGLRAVPPQAIVMKTCCAKAFLRGAFMASGAMSHPDKQYHFELTTSSRSMADYLQGLMLRFAIEGKMTQRNSKYIVYLKNGESISDMLSLMGAGRAMMDFENTRIKKEVSNRVNRQINCDGSNINRTMMAAETQTRDINYIMENIGQDQIPMPLRQLAFARLNNPEMPLGELGELLDPPLSKSGVNARMRKLTSLADKLRSGDEIDLPSLWRRYQRQQEAH